MRASVPFDSGFSVRRGSLCLSWGSPAATRARPPCHRPGAAVPGVSRAWAEVAGARGAGVKPPNASSLADHPSPRRDPNPGARLGQSGPRCRRPVRTPPSSDPRDMTATFCSGQFALPLPTPWANIYTEQGNSYVIVVRAMLDYVVFIVVFVVALVVCA